jgi:SAM-dependent methyltransferase
VFLSSMNDHGPCGPPVHTPAWSPDEVATFWNNYGSIPHFRSRFFARSWSEGILEVADRFVATDGVVLDYGCGRGDLLETLIARGRRCMGCDSSPGNVRAVQERFASAKGFFLGALLAPPPALPPAPDVVMLVEVVEHMPRAAVPGFLAGVASLLAPGGCIVVTCPNQEDLQAAEVLCPECGCRFHPVQHLQSLAPADVAVLATGAGFETLLSGATRFRKTGESHLTARLYAGWYRWFGKAPHLVYIGRKR